MKNEPTTQETSLEKKPSQQGDKAVDLGDGQVFIKWKNKEKHIGIKAVATKRYLKEAEKLIYKVPGSDDYAITAAGYNDLNKIAGLSILTPKYLELPDGSKVINPYLITDKESGTLEKVWVKKVVAGYSPTGNFVVTTSTLFYDARMYYIQDLFNKIISNKNAGRVCTYNTLADEEKASELFLRFQGNLGIYPNMDNMDILKATKTFVNNKQFAERKAVTICTRNAMKIHPALSNVIVSTTGPIGSKVAKVQVIGWTSDLTKEELNKLILESEEGELDSLEIGGRKVQVLEGGVSTADAEDNKYVEADIEDLHEIEQNNNEPSTMVEEKTNTKPAIDLSNRIKELLDFNNILEGSSVEEIVKTNFNKDIKELTIEQLNKVETIVIDKIDKENEGAF